MVTYTEFLKDVFICSLGAYGGPAAHYGVFIDRLVINKKYLTEEELTELIGLCSILPGPSSTQTIVAIGHKIGGPILASLTMAVWAMPVIFFMIILSFLHNYLSTEFFRKDILRYISPMAVGFIIVAAYRIGKKVLNGTMTLILWFLSVLITYFVRNAVIFPIILILGGIISTIYSREKNIWNKISILPKWKYIYLLVSIAILSNFGVLLFRNQFLDIFEKFYRYGYMVFGGGQVVIPIMYNEVVEVSNYMSNREFLIGYGLVQGLPGPMFSFSAYVGGMAGRLGGVVSQFTGGILAAIGIFLPGLLLIYFVYPLWEELKKIKAIKLSLKGINAVAGGMITSSAIILLQKSGISLVNLMLTLAVVIAVLSKKIPAPFIVLITILTGIII